VIDGTIIDEIIALNVMRMQNAFVLDHSMLVLELYSPARKKLFFVFDTDQETRSIHVQREKPKGGKSKHPIDLLINKYGTGKSINFLKIDHDNQLLKAVFTHENISYYLMFEFFPHLTVGLFFNSDLLAYLGTNKEIKLKHGFIDKKPSPINLDKNFEQAIKHQELRKKHGSQAIFQDQINTLKKKIQKSKALLKNVEQDLIRCQKNLSLQEEAELLRANFHLLKRGLKEVLVYDYTADPPALKTIQLDPRLTPKELLLKSFQRIKKARRGIGFIEPRLILITEELEKLEREYKKLLTQGPLALNSNDDLQQKPVASKKKTAKRLPYRTYLSSDHIKILAGRSAEDSDDLTMHYARGNDWWFHVEQLPGAHVVVKCDAATLPEKTFLEACMLAQHFSKAKGHSSVRVQYTRAKHVRKPKNLSKGLVLISQEKNVEIDKDEGMLTALLAREQMSQ
jgi:predicted ribosome quality control (RQC) complex YloA/Tae2 family protein